MNIHVIKNIKKTILNNNVLLVFGFFILLGLSVYNYKSSRELKLTNSKLYERLNKITKLLTPTSTFEPTPTVIPSPTLISEYIFMTMPNNGFVLSCKRNSQQALIQASATFDSAQKDFFDCTTNFRNDCKKKCGGNTSSTCYRQNCTLLPDKTCPDFEANNKKTRDAFNKLIDENCIGGGNFGFN